MTAEVAILNSYGVALAADSAISIGVSDQPKIYNTGDKLFSLSKRAPVGAMVFGETFLAGVPWETIIKSFRQQLGDRVFGELTDYADALIQYIENTPTLFSPEQMKNEFEAHCSELYTYLRLLIEQHSPHLFDDKRETISGEMVEETSEETAEVFLEIFTSELQKFESQDPYKDIPDDYGAQITEMDAQLIYEIKERIFGDFLDENATDLLLDLTRSSIEKPHPEQPSNTGLVIAGFGETEFAPVLVEFAIYGILDGRLRRLRRSHHRIHDENRATLAPFAQREMVDLFMTGIDPNLHVAVEDTLRELTEELLDIAGQKISVDDENIRESLHSYGADLYKACLSNIKEQIERDHVRPVLDAVAALPKEELAEMAETLVNLTSFKRRVTLEAETVGGPIDVLVISKGDGLIWIRRKHYFDPSLNHHFFANYFHYGLPKQEDLA